MIIYDVKNNKKKTKKKHRIVWVMNWEKWRFAF